MSEVARKFSLSDFHSRSKANAGKKLFLTLPDGTVTEEWFLVVNCDSDVMAKAHAQSREDAVKNRMEPVPDPDFVSKSELKRNSAAVIDWSFPEPFSTEAVSAFLKEAPQIGEQIDRLIYDRQAFFGGAV